ncbi:copper amine oxidase N-terminal domain-containing protein [Alkaliphilus sp. MSJ-5]|uniref:Copper amine oxidase N-terminal domain-containing protein n=1 Tax=Alkaliphilus flagellatus TaxID=2841507 RepID=A0ABS6G8P2_9FIRM|nr:stalk domain-containing protein [Alkaliphilus flagellatus]MBU5677761.1 copper amine oxidase N-terminal domain-containing protein [Alkaliphilus flagellatus]
MKGKFAGFLTGVIVGGAVFGSAGVYAASKGSLIEVFNNVVKTIIIDGEDKTPKEQKDMPFVYNGTTYVPIRYISESMDKKVSWDGNTGTIFIGDTQEEASYFYKKPFAEVSSLITTREDIKGIALVTDFNWGNPVEETDKQYYKESIKYNLNGSVDKIAGSIEMLHEFGKHHESYEGNKKVSGRVRIYDSNDNMIYDSKLIRLGTDAIKFEIDAKNILSARFELYLETPNGQYGGGAIAIKNLRYY